MLLKSLLHRPPCINIKTSRYFSAISTGSNLNILKMSNQINRNYLLSNQRHFSYMETVTGIFQTLSQSAPVIWFQENLIHFHDISGLPWWATIVLSTFTLRLVVTTPLTIYQQITLARLELISLEMPEIQKQIRAEAVAGMKQLNWTTKQTELIYRRSVKKQWDNLIVRENCHPLKAIIVVWGQVPLWIIQSVAIRNLVSMQPDPSLITAQLALMQLTVGGFGFIPNLTEVDSSYIFPVLLAIINLANIELQRFTKVPKEGRMSKIALNIFRSLSIIMIPIAASVPSALSLYWTTSSAFGLIQTLCLMSPKVKRNLGIPQTPSQEMNPYNRLAMRITSLLRIEQQKRKD